VTHPHNRAPLACVGRYCTARFGFTGVQFFNADSRTCPAGDQRAGSTGRHSAAG